MKRYFSQFMTCYKARWYKCNKTDKYSIVFSALFKLDDTVVENKSKVEKEVGSRYVANRLTVLKNKFMWISKLNILILDFFSRSAGSVVVAKRAFFSVKLNLWLTFRDSKLWSCNCTLIILLSSPNQSDRSNVECACVWSLLFLRFFFMSKLLLESGAS